MMYTVTASPGGLSCSTQGLSCAVSGLSNRVKYSFTVVASNDVGASPGAVSGSVAPVAAGFQTWVDDLVLVVGQRSVLNIAGAGPGTSVTVTGGVKATVMADSDGFASVVFTAPKAGVVSFVAANTVRVGRVNVGSSASVRAFVPKVLGPFWKAKLGKPAVWKVSYAPAGSVVRVVLSDGRTLSGTVDSSGAATVSTTFATRGLATYTVTVDGSPVNTGELTITN